MKKISLDAIFKYSLLAFVFLVFHTTKYSGRIIEFLLIPCFILKIIKERSYIKTGLELPLGGFILSIYLSSINSFHPKSVFDFGKDTFKFFGLSLFISQFDLGLKDQKKLLYVGLLSFILKLSKASLEKSGYIEGLYSGIRISGGEEVWRYAGVVMCGFVITLVILFFKKNSKVEMALLTLLSLISGIVLLWTQNRGNWVGLSAVLSFILLIKLKKKSIPIFILAIFLMGGSIYYLPKNVYVKRVKSIVNLKTNRSNLGRIDLWKGSLRMYRENPVNGVGYSFRNFSNAEEPEVYMNIEKRPHGHSHNSFLYVLATMGTLGGGSYLILIGWIIKETLTIGGYYGLMTGGLLLSIESFGLFETPVKYFDVQGILYLIIGIMLINSKSLECVSLTKNKNKAC